MVKKEIPKKDAVIDLKVEQKAIDIYGYFDYRQLLKDLYVQSKKANPHFSYRFLGQLSGFKSAGYFANLLTGKCNLSLNVAYKLAQAFKLKKNEAEYFVALVLFNISDNQKEKKKYYQNLMELKRSVFKTLEIDQYELFSEWYNIAILEILDFYLFEGDYAELGKIVEPSIIASQAKKSIEVLMGLGLIRINPFGFYEKTYSVLTTPDYWQSMAISFYQQDVLELAKKSFDNPDRKARDISTLTVSIANSDVKKIHERLRHAREDILQIAEKSKDTDQVYQINFYSFPVSKKWSRA